MTIAQFAVFGDSNPQGTGPAGQSASIAQGGAGCWAELAFERLSTIRGLGPLVSSGLRGVWLAGVPGGDTEWSFTTGGNAWSDTASTDAWDRLFGKGVYANGINKVATATLPTTYRSAVGFAIYFMDYTGGGNWQYRINGGTWTNMGQTLAHDNLLAKFYVPSSLVAGSTVEVRCYDGSADCGCALGGIEWFYLDPTTTTQGFIGHNCGVNAMKLNTLVAATSGDRMAFVDSVKIDAVHGGGAITNRPNVGAVVDCINDNQLANLTTWNNDLTTFNTRMAPLGKVGFISTWEISTAVYTAVSQANYRAQTKTTAAALGVPVKDLFDDYSSLGWTTNALLAGTGILNADAIHASQAGHLDLADRVYWWVRTQLLTTIGPNLNPFRVGASGVGGTDGLGGMPVAAIVAATGTATAYAPAVSLAVPAQAATSTGAAFNPSIAVAAHAGAATGTGAAFNPSISVAANAGAATATGAAFNPTIAIGANAGAAIGTGTASSPGGTGAGTASAATGTATAFNPAISVAGNAGAATGVGAAFDARISTASNAGVATGAGAAFGPAIALEVHAGCATGIVSAADAGVTASSPGSASPLLATGTGAAFNPSASISTTAGAAFGTCTASAPAVTVTVDTHPGAATGTGTAFGPKASISVTAGRATGSGAAFNATVSSAGAPRDLVWSMVLVGARWQATGPTTPWRVGAAQH